MKAFCSCQRKACNQRSSFARARTGLAAAEASVRRTGLEMSRLDITAPFAGVIEEVQLEPGDYVTPGTACATLVDLDPMLLVGGIPEREFGNVRTAPWPGELFPAGLLLLAL